VVRFAAIGSTLAGLRPFCAVPKKGARMPRRHDRQRRDDEVIDLRDRLAPYSGSALRPVEHETATPPEEAEPVWTPLDLGVLYQTADRRND
jgi:hypothetical protein